MIRKVLNLFQIFVISLFCYTLAPAYENEPLSRTGRDIDKFKARAVVESLVTDNLKKINMIEIISKNFGYENYHQLKKDYWAARILVSKKQIMEAKALLEKNLKDINENMRAISKDYRIATQDMLDECIDKINALSFTEESDPNITIRRKLTINKKRIILANGQFNDANLAFAELKYVPSIYLYRNAKSHAINILKDLAAPEEKKEIESKFKIHIVDNRNEIFNEG